MKLVPLPTYILIISLALLTGVGCRDGARQSDSESLAKQFRGVAIHTNGFDAIAVIDTKTMQPIWMKWFFSSNGGVDQICYCFDGKPVMELILVTNGPPRRDVIYYDTNGAIKLLFGDRGGLGQFSDRITYVEGNPRQEIWHEDAWRLVNERDGVRGIILNGKWYRIGRFTNGAWSIITGDGSSVTNNPGDGIQ